MARRGTFYAVTPDEAERFLSLVGDDAALVKEAQGLFSFERQRAHLITPVDKTWDPMHRCLTDGTIRGLGKGASPLALCVLGGKSLHVGEEMILCLVGVDQVGEVSRALDEIEIQWFVSRFTSLPSLYSKALDGGRAVVFVAD
jgi:uncharacterized protein DUF1877